MIARILNSDVTPQPIQNDMPLPFCDYTIRKDAVDGEILKFARVGDLIVHRWQCHSGEWLAQLMNWLTHQITTACSCTAAM